MQLPQTAKSISFVTGVDHQMFDQLFLLMGSLRRSSPSIELLVCDFGLSDRQRGYLHQKNMLLRMPDGMGKPPHPWYYKGALGQYVAHLGTNAIVWLDADLIILSDIKPALEELCASMQRSGEAIAAAGRDTLTIGDQLAMDPAPHYARLVAGFSAAAPYLNSGFFLCRSMKFLQDWATLCATMPMELLFEQNAFNLTALASRERVRVVDPSEWNLSAADLRAMEIETSGQEMRVTGPRGKARILHVTSVNRARDLIFLTMQVVGSGATFRPCVRMILQPELLMEFEKRLVVEAISADFHLLTASGLATPS
jgi:hypothetical protein